MPGWRDQVIAEVTAVSGRPASAWQWIREVDNKIATFATLGNSGDTWDVLDSKLATGLRKVITGEPGLRIKREAKRLEKLGIMTTGRQLLYLLYDEFTSAPTSKRRSASRTS